MSKEKICGIYCIENSINKNKYIGQSVNIYARWYSHRRYLKNNIHYNNHLQSSWNEYGEHNFVFYIVQECKKEELDNLEEFYILKYDSIKNGYNQRPGGNTSQITETQRIKIGITNSKKKRTDAFKSHLSKVNSGRVFRHNVVNEFDRNHNFIQSFFSIAEASRLTGISYSTIRNSCLNLGNIDYEHIWEFNQVNKIKIKEEKDNMVKNELLTLVAEKTEMTKADVDRVLKAFEEVVTTTLTENKDEKITLGSLGSFKAKQVPERVGTIQLGERKGEKYKVDAHSEITFKMNKSAKTIA